MSVTLFEEGLRQLLVLPHGPVIRHVTEKAERVAELARQNVRAQFTSRTGNLENSIDVFPQEGVNGPEFEVGTEGAPYGKVLEEGSDPHPIFAKRANTLWSLTMDPNHPDPLYSHGLRVVDHPGNPPRPWLKPALETVFNGA